MARSDPKGLEGRTGILGLTCYCISPLQGAIKDTSNAELGGNAEVR